MVRTVEEKIEAVAIFFECQRNFHAAERIFNERHPERLICRKYLRELISKFLRTGSVHTEKRPGRPSLSNDKQIDIVAEVLLNPIQSTSQVALLHDVCPRSVHRVLKKNHFHPYKMKMLQELAEDDPDRRMEFCEIMTEKIAQHEDYLRSICFSDECSFFLTGTVNRQNVRYWSDHNPHWYREGHTQYPQKLNVWAGILGDHIVGPFFIEGNLTGPLYLNMLQNEIEPEINRLIQANPEEFQDLEITFQQDGAPPHYFRQVRTHLDNVYRNRWIGRRGPLEWPPRSPDLTPMDFFLWGYLKSKVFITEPDSLLDLRQRIIDECVAIPRETFSNVRQEISNRLYHCQEVQGRHFEQLL